MVGSPSMEVFKKRVDPPVMFSQILHVFLLTELVRKMSPALLESARVSNIQPQMQAFGVQPEASSAPTRSRKYLVASNLLFVITEQIVLDVPSALQCLVVSSRESWLSFHPAWDMSKPQSYVVLYTCFDKVNTCPSRDAKSPLGTKSIALAGLWKLGLMM